MCNYSFPRRFRRPGGSISRAAWGKKKEISGSAAGSLVEHFFFWLVSIKRLSAKIPRGKQALQQ